MAHVDMQDPRGAYNRASLLCRQEPLQPYRLVQTILKSNSTNEKKYENQSEGNQSTVVSSVEVRLKTVSADRTNPLHGEIIP